MSEKYLGCFYTVGNGNAVVKLKDESEIFIYSENKGMALHKDLVEARIVKVARGKRIGAVTKVIERGNAYIIGTSVEIAGRMAIDPDDKHIDRCIYIEDGGGKVDCGHKLAVKLTRQSRKHIYCKVILDLGQKGAPGVDILSVVYQMEIPYIFPRNVLLEASCCAQSVDIKDFPERRDITGLKTVTIDSKDTKDIDDAVSLQVLKNGDYLLTVSIADVSHYVREGAALDKEALRRGTSIYLADRVVPMLPRELSNGICSLNEGEPRLALSCEMRINKKGKCVSRNIFESVIVSDKKMTYEAVSDFLKYGKAQSGYEEYEELMRNMNALYEILKDKRLKRGAIEFDFPESKIILDAYGKPRDILVMERNAATGIIEEFMILCNESVAEEYFWTQTPFIYRCHEEPDAFRRQKFKDFLKSIGYTFKGKRSSAYQALLNKVKDTPEENMVGAVMLRSLMQAVYTHENIGHFGLASECYCHFTSPIRRYPDLMIHRIIKKRLKGVLTQEQTEHYNKLLPDICKKTSFTERRAVNCERDILQMKKIEYMSEHIGQVYDGLISGVTRFGIFVSLSNTAEGLIPMSCADDRYHLDETGLCLIGEYTKKILRIGGRVRVRVMKADAENRKLDLKIV